jgi:ribosomal protein S18 acetylase RimI-like enzyme
VIGRSPDLPGKVLYVDSLVTATAFRRRGVARGLLALAEERARELGLPRLALDTHLDNVPARALYERQGFVEYARAQPVPNTPGHVYYMKDLTRRGP